MARLCTSSQKHLKHSCSLDLPIFFFCFLLLFLTFINFFLMLHKHVKLTQLNHLKATNYVFVSSFCTAEKQVILTSCWFCKEFINILPIVYLMYLCCSSISFRCSFPPVNYSPLLMSLYCFCSQHDSCKITVYDLCRDGCDLLCF